jgi:hypothetical protein
MIQSKKPAFIVSLEKRMSKKMPEVLRQINVYEQNLKAGKLTSNPTVSPQFNEQ